MILQFATDSDELKARFDLDGFISFGRICDAAEVQTLGEHIDAICAGTVAVPERCVRYHQDMEASGVSRVNTVWQLLNADRYDPVIRELCEKPLIQETIELLLGGSARLDSTQVIMKPAHHGSVVPWHQDSSYWGQEKRMTCWLAVDDATPFNGCMRMIPGSHRRGQVKFTSKAYANIGTDLLETDDVDENTQLYVPVNAGCASFHHPMTVHASDPNITSGRRRAIAITFLKTEA